MTSMPSDPHLQLDFLTGQSDPRLCALSPAQQAFGEAFLAPGRVLRRQNFLTVLTPHCTHSRRGWWRAGTTAGNTCNYVSRRLHDATVRLL